MMETTYFRPSLEVVSIECPVSHQADKDPSFLLACLEEALGFKYKSYWIYKEGFNICIIFHKLKWIFKLKAKREHLRGRGKRITASSRPGLSYKGNSKQTKTA